MVEQHADCCGLQILANWDYDSSWDALYDYFEEWNDSVYYDEDYDDYTPAENRVHTFTLALTIFQEESPSEELIEFFETFYPVHVVAFDNPNYKETPDNNRISLYYVQMSYNEFITFYKSRKN